MHNDDECQALLDAWKAAQEEAEEFCNLAEEAYSEWQSLLEAARSDCAADQGDPPEINKDMDPMLKHVLEQELEEYNQKLQECINGHSDVHDAYSLYLDLRAACDIAREEAAAAKDEYDACINDQHECIPFA